MISLSLSVEATSGSYAAGRVSGVLLVGVISIVLVWRLTASWRKAVELRAVSAAEATRVQTRRHILVIGVMVLIAVGSTLRAAHMYSS